MSRPIGDNRFPSHPGCHSVRGPIGTQTYYIEVVAASDPCIEYKHLGAFWRFLPEDCVS